MFFVEFEPLSNLKESKKKKNIRKLKNIGGKWVV